MCDITQARERFNYNLLWDWTYPSALIVARSLNHWLIDRSFSSRGCIKHAALRIETGSVGKVFGFGSMVFMDLTDFPKFVVSYVMRFLCLPILIEYIYNIQKSDIIIITPEVTHEFWYILECFSYDNFDRTQFFFLLSLNIEI